MIEPFNFMLFLFWLLKTLCSEWDNGTEAGEVVERQQDAENVRAVPLQSVTVKRKRDVLEYMKQRDDKEETVRNEEADRRKTEAKENRELKMKETEERRLLAQAKLEHLRREGEADRKLREKALEHERMLKKIELEVRKQEANNSSSMLKYLMDMQKQQMDR